MFDKIEDVIKSAASTGSQDYVKVQVVIEVAASAASRKTKSRRANRERIGTDDGRGGRDSPGFWSS